MNNIELSTIYLPLLDQKYKAEAKTSVLDGDETVAKKGGNGEIKIAKLDMSALGDFDRKSGYTKGNTTLTWETIKYDKERSQDLRIDRLDNAESLGLPFAKLSGEFMRLHVAPETDAARIAKIAGTDGISKKEETLDTGEAVVAALRACTNKMDEDEVVEENRILFITPTLLGMLSDMDSYKSKEVLSRFSQVIKVPQSRMYTKIDLKAGKTEYGFAKAADGKSINFLCVEKSAVVSAMEQFVKYFSPDQDQEGDSHVFKYRNYNLYAHVYENKLAGIYCSLKAGE
jgi:hypothetical protein|nr:MAG TPA: Major capsid protein [Siphoviridae sp. ctqOv4]